jgi:hypothetical protein
LTALSFDLAPSRVLVPGAFPRWPRPEFVSEHRGTSTPGFSLSFRVWPEPTPAPRALHASAPTGAVPLLGFKSLQRSPARRIRCPRWLPRHQHLAPSGFSRPLDAFSPLRAFQRLPAGPLLGLSPSGPCSCRQLRRPFEHVPSPLDVTHPDRRTLAMTSDRTRACLEGINPRA